MSIKLTTKRGRPPAYDREQALAALTDVFWLNGYAATSLDALSAATGMARPSLYAAFGDKQAMYLSALDRVRAMLSADLSALDAHADLGEALRIFFSRALAVYLTGGEHPRGCIAICTAASAAAVDGEVRTALAGVIAMIDEALLARIARAQEEGQLSLDQNVRALAVMASASLHSLAIRARAGSPRTELEAMIEATVEIVVGCK